jgi:hypothetical protein
MNATTVPAPLADERPAQNAVTETGATVSAAPLWGTFEIPGLLLVDDGLVAPDIVASLSRAIADSKLMGTSQLDGAFSATRGFGIACHLGAIDDVIVRVPFLRPFLDLALDDALLRRLLRFGVLERVAAALLGVTNALYVNVLVVPPGTGVQAHVDATLGVATAAPGDDAPLSPRAVVVLYVDAAAGTDGGMLHLTRGQTELVATIAPRAGRVVVFRGSLRHEVTPTSPTQQGSRVSVVAELYGLPRKRLARLPRLRVQSHGFAAVLDRLRRERTPTSSTGTLPPSTTA